MAENPYDEAVKNMIYRVAASRFTKTPIEINGDLGLNESRGRFYSSPNRIDIDLGQNPDYREFSNILHHEDIHALLNKANMVAPNPDMGSFVNQIKNLFSIGAVRSMYQGMQKARRAGDPLAEMPAYAGAYDTRDIPSVTPQDATAYTEVIKRLLPPPVATNYQRIIDSVKASKK